MDEADGGVFGGEAFEDEGEHCCGVDGGLVEGVVSGTGEVEIVFGEGTFLAAGEDVDDVWVGGLEEEGKEELEGADAGVEAGCH